MASLDGQLQLDAREMFVARHEGGKLADIHFRGERKSLQRTLDACDMDHKGSYIGFGGVMDLTPM